MVKFLHSFIVVFDNYKMIFLINYLLELFD